MPLKTIPDDPESTDTDWLATCADGYGYGYTKAQALLALAPNFELPADPETHVTLIEHVGNAETGLMGWQVDHLIRKEVVKLTEEQVEDLRHHGAKAKTAGYTALDAAEQVETYEPDTPHSTVTETEEQ